MHFEAELQEVVVGGDPDGGQRCGGLVEGGMAELGGPAQPVRGFCGGLDLEGGLGVALEAGEDDGEGLAGRGEEAAPVEGQRERGSGVGGGEVEVGAAFGVGLLVVLEPGLGEAGGGPVAFEAGVALLEVGEALGLDAIGFELGAVAGEDVPLLALDAVVDEGALVDGDGLQVGAAPGGDLLAVVADVGGPGGDGEGDGDVDCRFAVGLGGFGCDGEVAAAGGGAGEAAGLGLGQAGQEDERGQERFQSQGRSSR